MRMFILAQRKFRIDGVGYGKQYIAVLLTI